MFDIVDSVALEGQASEMNDWTLDIDPAILEDRIIDSAGRMAAAQCSWLLDLAALETAEAMTPVNTHPQQLG